MSKENIIHVCEDCALRKEVILENVDVEDVEVYELIYTGINTAKTASDPSVIPDGISEEKMKAYFEAAFAKEAHYKKLEAEWWRKILSKYKISDKTKIDTINCNFYHCIDKDGKEQIDFVSKHDEARGKIEAIK
jgi:hypothetical protein